jgi:3-isopropylmalate/(R)-2-methylmalate dehydratase large subunit
MAMTITEKILAAHAGRDAVRPGEFLYASLDLLLGNDITAPIGIEEFRRAGLTEVWDPHRIVLVPDHFTPNKDIKSAEQVKVMREFAQEQGLTHYFEVGRMGIEHALLPEQGLVAPGDLIIGADSHTCTYGAVGAFSTGVGSTDFAAGMATGKVWLRVPESLKFIFSGKLGRWVGGKDLILYTIGKIGVSGATYRAMEFTGETIESLPMDDRLTMCNMAIEAGGKNGIVPPDAVTEGYCRGRAQHEYTVYASDPDADYAEVYEWDVHDMPPMVARPHLPENAVPVNEVNDVRVDQVVIGSCTNGRLSDLQIAAEVLRGKKAAPNVRLIIIPATQAIYRAALDEGLFDVFLDAEAVVSTPTCGPCLGGHMGVLASGERAVATTNRNFVGRMGEKDSEVYLAGPAVAAASAVTGRITHPDEVAR